MTSQSPEELAAMLRRLAEMTASGSKNWDNFEAILLDAIRASFRAGKSESNDTAK